MLIVHVYGNVVDKNLCTKLQNVVCTNTWLATNHNLTAARGMGHMPYHKVCRASGQRWGSPMVALHMLNARLHEVNGMHWDSMYIYIQLA